MKLFLKIHVFILLTFVNNMFSQESITDLQINNVVRQHYLSHGNILKKLAPSDTLELPFFDDFSNNDIFPDQKKWKDNYVFVNNTYEVNPISSGVATFDAIDNTGIIYAGAGLNTFSADMLTSRPLNLEGKTDVWLSFYYQAEGMGEKPDKYDSLLLEFKSPDDSVFTKVAGFANVKTDTFFLAMVPIDDEKYLKYGFQFRFRNYASLNPSPEPSGKHSSVDHWNIDYVYLDDDRNEYDTIWKDLTFTKPLQPILKTYSSVPWKHYETARLSAININYPLDVHNYYSDTARNFEILVKIKNRDNNMSSIYDYGTFSSNPYKTIFFRDTLDVFRYLTDLNFSDDSAAIELTTYINYVTNNRVENDTLRKTQVFNNWYAYDDGSSEGNYGFKGSGAEAALYACKFFTYVPDDINAIHIAFNPVYNDTTSNEPFKIMIWSSHPETGLPDQVLYEKEEKIKNPLNNTFSVYPLDETINVTGNFFIGWKQVIGNYLNLGYDKNSFYEGKQFINIDGSWTSSFNQGMVMMRPAFGKKVVGIHQRYLSGTVAIYPNPANNYLNITVPEDILNKKINISVFDISGRQVFNSSSFTERIDVSGFKEGMYILKISVTDSPDLISRFIVSKR